MTAPVGGYEYTLLRPLREIASSLPELIALLRQEIASLKEGTPGYYNKLRELAAAEQELAKPLRTAAPPIVASHRYRIDDDKGDTVAHIEVKDNGGVLWLDNLWVQSSRRRQGYATALLERAVGEWQGRELYLLIQPYTDQPLSAEQLAAFYGSFGFEVTDVPGVLRRRARPWVGRPPREG